MSFLTRKPENAASPAPSGSENASGGSTTNPDLKVSLSDLYNAIANSQKQLTDYLIARELEGRSAASGASASGSGSGSAGDGGARVDMRMFADQLHPIMDTLNMIGQYLDGQMMSAISSRFDTLETLLRALPSSASSGSSANLTGSANSASSVSSANSGTSGGAGVSGNSAGSVGSDSAAPGAQQSAQSGGNVQDLAEPGIPEDMKNTQYSGSSGVSSSISAAKPASARPSAVLQQLDKAIFGEMALEPSINNERQYLLQGILAHDAVCSYFGGILMMFQSSVPDKMVLLLKDLGEAFYRWTNSMPGNNFEQFEDVLARWAQWQCESAGLPNHIETVMIGQRFDASRHNSISRGVTITQVHGWVVLRGNGSVYSKALVDVQ